MTNTTPDDRNGSLNSLGLAPLFTEVLGRIGITIPTVIQEKAIPLILEGKDVIGIAQTGTGKTLAFGLPMLQRLAIHKGVGLVLVPTRELAQQVDEKLIAIGKGLGLRTAVLVGGASMGKQLGELRAKPQVIIATPGRLNDHIRQRTVDLRTVTILVLDEADHMLDMGFEPQIRDVVGAIPKTRQTLLFSATMPTKIQKLAESYMRAPVTAEATTAGTVVAKISEEIYFISKEEKVRLLEKILSEHTGSILVFSRTKHGAKRLVRHVHEMGHSAIDIHSNKSLPQRRAALEGFKKRTYRILIATDIAARGIDVTDIELVVNYDLPDSAEDYVHRIGRTGRAGKVGKAISFAEHNQRYDVKNIERLTRKPLPEKRKPELPPARVSTIQDSEGHQRESRYGSRSSRSGATPRGNQRFSRSR